MVSKKALKRFEQKSHGFVPGSPIFPSLPLFRLPEDNSSDDRLRARVLSVGSSRLHNVLPLIEGIGPCTQRRPSLLLCLWGTAVCATLSSRCSRGHGRVPSPVLPASPSPTPAGTLLLFACSSEEQRRDRPACPWKCEPGPGCSSSTETRTPPEATC